jgi:hypothetical protein
LQVKPRFQSGGVSQVVDSSLGDDYDETVLKVMIEVALTCTAFSKKDRPTMKVRIFLETLVRIQENNF